MTPLSTLSLLPTSTAPSSALVGASPQSAADGAAFALLLPAGITPGTVRQADAEAGKGLPAIPRDDDDVAEDATMPWVSPPLWDAARPPIAAAPKPGETTIAPSLTSSIALAVPVEAQADVIAAPVPSIGDVGDQSIGSHVAAVGVQTAAPLAAGRAAPIGGPTTRAAMLSTTAAPVIADQPFPATVPAIGAAAVSVVASAASSGAEPTLAAGAAAPMNPQQPSEALDPLPEHAARPTALVSDARVLDAKSTLPHSRDVAPTLSKVGGRVRAGSSAPNLEVPEKSTAPAAIAAPAADERPSAAVSGEAMRPATPLAIDPRLVVAPGLTLRQENTDEVSPQGGVTSPVDMAASPVMQAAPHAAKLAESVKADRQLGALLTLAPIVGNPAGEAPGNAAAPLATPTHEAQLAPVSPQPALDQRTPVVTSGVTRPVADMAQPVGGPAAAMPASDRQFVDDAAVAPPVAGAARSIAKEWSTAATPAPVVVAPPVTEPAPAARIAPAGQIFAAAMHQMFRDERRAETADPTGVIVAGAGEIGLSAAGPTDGARHAAIDMAREAWPAKMIERIEMIRDALNATDTSIRLVPDKLGAIDVSLRQDGDKVQVQFTAQQAETRQLLADAQPKLAELAEAKGLKLSAQFGDGGAQAQAQAQSQSHSQHQQRAPSGAQTSNLRPGRAASNDDAGTLADERIA